VIHRLIRLATRASRTPRTESATSRPTIERLEDRRHLSASPFKAAGVVKGSHTYKDGSFLDANWTSAYTSVGNGGEATATRVKKGGAPGAYRRVDDTVFDASFFYVFYANNKANYNPATQGAITSINYSESNKLISGFGQGQGTGPALIQNGTIYLATASALITPQSTWKKSTLTHLTADNFAPVADATAHPDFSQGAAPIQFGFYRGNSATFSYSISAAIDNWNLKVFTAKTKG